MIYPDSFEHKIGFDAVRRAISELCVSPMGVRRVQQVSMSADVAEVSASLMLTDRMLACCRSDDPLHLDGLTDLSDILLRARPLGTFIAAPDMMVTARMLRLCDEVVRRFTTADDDSGAAPQSDPLRGLAGQITPLPSLLKAIDSILDRYGEVRDSASPELARIRHELSGISGTVNSIMRRVIAAAVAQGYLDSDTAPAMRDGRLVLPVSPMNKRKIPGIVHDESASGKTVFIEPGEVVQANNRIRELQAEEKREVARILTALTDRLRPDIDTILTNQDVMGHLDFVRAKALYADRIDGRMPHIEPDGTPHIEWFHAVHPVLLLSLARQNKEIVPLDITLGHNHRILIISGPNAGGKSVCLKTVGIVQYMLQCGLLPPVYENSHFGLFSDIFIDIGDDQSIEDDLSTYSSHLRNMRQMLHHGNSSSLLLIDEFGGGTEPQIGAAIAQAILKEFNDAGMWGVITTHYQNLKHFAEDTDGLVNGSMLYDRHLMQPLYKLSVGMPGSSFALEIARKTGMPQSVIDNAREIVGSDYVNMDKYLLDIARDRRYWENKRLAIRQKEKRIEQVLAQYESDADTLRQQRRQILADAKEEARQILDGSNAAIERTIHDIKRAQADRERTLEARRRLQEQREQLRRETAENPLLAKAPKSRNKPQPKPRKPVELAVGDYVKLDGQGTPGRVLQLSGKTATVAFGQLKTTVRADRLQPTMQRPQTPSPAGTVTNATVDAQRQHQLNFKTEIDLRGMRADEALQAVTYYIDDAIRFSAGRVRILHGTGTGALRQVIRQYMATQPGVASYHDEDVRFGGAGITVVDLE